jgi:hypothetical protein
MDKKADHADSWCTEHGGPPVEHADEFGDCPKAPPRVGDTVRFQGANKIMLMGTVVRVNTSPRCIQVWIEARNGGRYCRYADRVTVERRG